MTTGPSKFRYQPPLDGVRAVAVLAVLCYHYGYGNGGGLGVDVFLVLSGFLITSLLDVERSNTGTVDLLAFWGRRIRRLLPALLVMLAIVGLYALVAAPQSQLARIRDDGLATLFYVENWHLVSAGFRPSPLNHTWSLAIEEQWYLIWPPLFMALMWLVRGSTRLMVVIVTVLALASAWEMWEIGPGGRSYWSTDTRAQALLLGAALGLLFRVTPGPVRRVSRVALEVAGLAGLVVFVAMATNQPSWMFRGGYLLVAVASALIIAASVQDGSRVLRPLLSLAPLRWLGLISYGVYLYHFPILFWLNERRTGLSDLPLTLLRFSITVLVATASYFLIELPVRRGTFLPRRAQVVVAPVAVALSAVLVLATTMAAPAERDLSANGQFWQLVRQKTPPGVRRAMLVGDGEVAEHTIAMPLPYDVEGLRGVSVGLPDCRLEDTARPDPRVAATDCAARWNGAREALRVFEPHTVVLLFATSELSGRPGDPDPAARARQIHAALAEVKSDLRPQADLVLLTPPCARSGAGPDPAPTAADRAWLTEVLRRAAARDPKRVRVLDYAEALCEGNLQRGTLDGVDLRGPDGVLTREGARAIWSWIEAGLRSAQPGRD